MRRDYRIGMSTRISGPIGLEERAAKSEERAIKRARLKAEAERENREYRARLEAEETKKLQNNR